MTETRKVVALMTIEQGTPARPVAPVAPGAMLEIPADDPDGFVARGIARDLTDQELALLETAPASPQIDVPAGWRDLGAADMVALAHKLGAGGDVETKTAAAEYIGRMVADRSDGQRSLV